MAAVVFSSPMNHSKTILFITHRYEPDLGGLSKSASRISQQLAKMGMQVHVLVLSREFPQGIIQQDRKQHVNELTVFRMGISSRHTTTMMLALHQIRTMHQDHGYDLIWGHYAYPSGFLACLAAREVGTASTVSIRGNDLDTALFSGQAFSHLLWTIESATALSCVSTQYAQRLRGMSEKIQQVVVLGNATDTDVFAPSSVADKSPLTIHEKPNPFVLGFSGELREKKGLIPFMEAFDRLSRLIPVRALVVGEVRRSDQHLVDRFLEQKQELRSYLTITGHLDDPLLISEYYQNMDVVFQPSLWDGLPNSILEAMACQRIVLAGQVGGITDVIEHGKNGFLISMAQMSKAAEGLMELFHMSEDQKLSIGQAARRTVLERYSLATETLALEMFVQSL